jgi:predicted DNA-binding protein
MKPKKLSQADYINTVSMSFELPMDYWKRLKVICEEIGMTQKNFIKKALVKEMLRYEVKSKPG